MASQRMTRSQGPSPLLLRSRPAKGRAIGIGLTIAIALIGTVTATVASWLESCTGT